MVFLSGSLDILLRLKFFTRISGNLSPSPLGKFILAGIVIRLPQQCPELHEHNLPKSFHTEQLPNVPEGANIGTSGPIARLQRRLALAKGRLRRVSSSNRRGLIKGSAGYSSLVNVDQDSRTVKRRRDTEQKGRRRRSRAFLPDTGSAPSERGGDGAGHLRLVLLLFERAECR